MALAVAHITRMQAAPFIIDRHYAGRWPSVSWAFGLFDGGDLRGVLTYGTPSSAPLRSGICGNDFAADVIELNRLCLRDNKKNEASHLVAKSLKMLPRPKIVVSFADISQGHTGYVYQAANFLYCGLSAKRTDWKIRGKEHLHGQTVADEFRGMSNRADLMRAKYGDDFYLIDRPRKHRYVMIIGSAGFKARARQALMYPALPYPKEIPATGDGRVKQTKERLCLDP